MWLDIKWQWLKKVLGLCVGQFRFWPRRVKCCSSQQRNQGEGTDLELDKLVLIEDQIGVWWQVGQGAQNSRVAESWGQFRSEWRSQAQNNRPTDNVVVRLARQYSDFLLEYYWEIQMMVPQHICYSFECIVDVPVGSYTDCNDRGIDKFDSSHF